MLIDVLIPIPTDPRNVRADFGPQFHSRWFTVELRSTPTTRAVTINWVARGAVDLKNARKFLEIQKEAVQFAEMLEEKQFTLSTLHFLEEQVNKAGAAWLERIQQQDPDGNKGLYREWA